MKPESEPEFPKNADDIPAAISTMPECAAMEADLSALRDQYLRLAADFDNFRKRTARDADQRADVQKISFIRELLAVVDNLERALAVHAPVSEDPLRRGIEMTHRELLLLLHRHGIKPDDPAGLPFDPHRHEAVNIRFDPAHADHLVLEVLQCGYLRGTEIIRPARVIVNDLSTGEKADDAA